MVGYQIGILSRDLFSVEVSKEEDYWLLLVKTKIYILKIDQF